MPGYTTTTTPEFLIVLLNESKGRTHKIKCLVLICNIKFKSLLDPKQSCFVIEVIQCEISNNIQILPRKSKDFNAIAKKKKKNKELI